MSELPNSEELDALRRQWEQEPTPQRSLQLAEEYGRRGDHRLAVEILERGLEARPGHLSARVALGRYRVELGEPEAAVRELEKVVSEDPTHLVANKLLAKVYSSLGETAKARDRLDLYGLLNESDPEIESLRRTIEQVDDGAEEMAGPPEEPTPVAAEPEPPEVVEPSPLWEAEELVAGALDATGAEPQEKAKAPAQDLFPSLFEGLESREYWRALGREGLFAVPFDTPGEPLAAGPAATAVLEPGPPARESVEEVPAAVPDEVPEDAAASVTLGALYREQGHLEEARAVYRSVLERQPGNREALAGLAALARGDDDRLTAFDLVDGSALGRESSDSGRRAAVIRAYRERLREGRSEDV